MTTFASSRNDWRDHAGKRFERGGGDDARQAVIGECPPPLLVKGDDFIHRDLTPALREN
jgi:uncharacterized protein with PIN domain